MPGLCVADVTNGLGKGNPGIAWLLDADEGGIGGENGRGGYCAIEVDAGEIDGGGGSSSPNETPRARSFASLSSSTYLFHAANFVRIGASTFQKANHVPFKSGRRTFQLLWFRSRARSVGSGQAPLLCDCSLGLNSSVGEYRSKPSML